MPDVNELNVPGEDFGEIGAIDYDAPEAGSFAPVVVPGTYTATFKLAESDPFGNMEVDGHNYLQVTHSAVINVNGEDKEVTFQRASWYQSKKMADAHMNAAAAELTRSLGIRLEGKLTPQRWMDALKAADGRASFTAVYGWELYCRDCKETTVSTSPNKKKKQQPWPSNADGTPQLTVKCPKCKGTPTFGTVRIVRYKLPDKAVQTMSTQVPAGGAVKEEEIPF